MRPAASGIRPGAFRARQSVGWWAALLCVLLWGSTPHAESAEQSDEPVDYVIVVTGSELLAGAYADAHTAFLTRSLHPRGLRCVAAMIADDSADAIQKAVRVGLDRAKLVLVTGGLGPTEDDVTREALSELTGVPLREHPELLASMARRFNTPVEQLRANLRRQTEVPVGGAYLDNPNGSAAGLIFEADEGLIIALPGPPRELQPMVYEGLVPYLTKRFGIRAVGGLLRVRFVGMGESAISDTLDRTVSIPDDVTVGSLFEGMRVDFYFSLPGSTPEELARLDVLKAQVLGQLGDFVYGTGATTLESHVVELLNNRRQTLALAEVATGGSLAAGLGGVEGVADVLAGAYMAPSAERLARMLGKPEVAEDVSGKRLARQLAQVTGADWALYVGPVVGGNAAGERSVEVVVHLPDGGTESRSLSMRGTGDVARLNLTTQLLDLLRRRVRP